MGRTSIEWTDYTFNPWRGCFKVSPGCKNCYADRFDARGLHGTERHWGETAPRAFQSDAYWRQPLRWNKKAELLKVRPRVFCASMADVFEDRDDLVPWRRRLFELIDATPSLDWLLLTKRPENIRSMLPWGWLAAMDRGVCPPNVWLGTSVEDQQRANERIPRLLSVPAAVHFLSMEPLLEPINLDPLICPNCDGDEVHVEELKDKPGFTTQPWCTECDVEMGSPDWLGVDGIDWVIIGGESGPGARPFNTAWVRQIVAQCRHAGVRPFVKQMGAAPWEIVGDGVKKTTHQKPLYLRDKKGKDMTEWPADLCVREFPDRSA